MSWVLKKKKIWYRLTGARPMNSVKKLSDEKSLSKQALRIRLDTTENRKHYNKIIFKYVNSTVGPIFNENVIEK